MKLLKDMSLIAIGVGATLAYQKYGQDMMCCMEDTMSKMVKKTTKKLDDMMQ